MRIRNIRMILKVSSVCCLMLASMSLDLQKQHEDMNAFTMLNHLKALYDKRARNERYDIS